MPSPSNFCAMPGRASGPTLFSNLTSFRAMAAGDGESSYGWKDFGDYFEQKKQKLFVQNEELRNEQQLTAGDGTPLPGSRLLKDIVVYIDGWTTPPAHELKKIVLTHGGYVNQYPSKTNMWVFEKGKRTLCRDGLTPFSFKTHRTHVIAENLTIRKFDQWKGLKVVTPKWIMESIEASKVLPWNRYRLVLNSASQSRIDNFSKAGGSSGQSASVEESEEADGQVSAGQQASAVLVPASDDDPPPVARDDDDDDAGQKEDNEGERVDQSDPMEEEAIPQQADEPVETETVVVGSTTASKPTSPDKQPAGAAGPSNPTTPTKDQTNAASKSNSTSPTNKPIHPELQSEWARKNSSIAPDFLDKFFGNSRLHHISTAKINMQEFVRRETEGKPRPKPNPNGLKTIMHVDMDCFFVSVALASRPDLAGKPAAVCHARQTGASTHSEIASCNYAARAFGLKNGMWTGEARKLCPDLVMLGYEFEKYTAASEAFYRVLISEADEIQANSVDEAFIDVSSRITERGKDQELELAEEIRRKVREANGVPCSIGIGESMLAARMATKRAKPDGAFWLAQDQVAEHLTDLPVDQLPGIGRETSSKLAKMLITTCGELRAAGKGPLQRELGEKTGALLFDFARGIDPRKLKQDPGPRRTVSAEANWGVRFEEVSQVEQFILQLAKEVSKRMHEANVTGKLITLTVRKRNAQAELIAPKSLGCGWSDPHSRSTSLLQATGDGEVIGRECVRMYRDLHMEVLEIRGIGIHMSKLEQADAKGKGMRKIMDMFGNAVAAGKGKEVVRDEEGSGVGSGAEESVGGDAPRSERARSVSVEIQEVAVAAKVAPNKQLTTRAGSSSKPAAPIAGDLHPTSVDQLDESVLKELPPDVQAQVLRDLKLPPKPGVSATGVNPFARTTAAAAKGSKPPAKPSFTSNNNNNNSSKNQPRIQSRLGPSSKTTVAAKHANKSVRLFGLAAEALPSRDEIDPAVLAELPADVQKELQEGWRVMDSGKKRNGGGVDGGALKKFKADAAGPAAKVGVAAKPAAQQKPASPPPAAPPKPTVPELMGKTDPDEVRQLLRDWIDSCPDDGPLEADLGTFVEYCKDLVQVNGLGPVESVVACLARHAKGKQGWTASVKSVVGTMQGVIEAKYEGKSAVLAGLVV